MKNNRYEQGGVVSFLVVVLVLGALLVGGILLVKQHTKNTQNDSNQIAVSQSSEKDDQNANKGNSEANTALSSESSSETNSTAPLNGDSHSSSNSALPSNGPSEAGELPSTGPAENTLAVVAAAALGGGIYSYVRSRQLVKKNSLTPGL